MANLQPGALSSQRARNGEYAMPLSASSAEATTSKRDLTSWWKQFKKGNTRRSEEEEKAAQNPGIFGVPLQTSIRYANVAISLYDNDGRSYIYGYVPIVVAKCGVFLKEKATDVEGIFRLSGSEKRIKELKIAFDSPDRFGKGLNWEGYTVHDAANILRRYFNQLPEPIIPLEFYERFRDPLREHQAQAVGEMDGQRPSVGEFDINSAIRTYQQLITELPPLNRQLLLYILDLLAVFASKADLNKMTTPNLAAIFQPGILSHPQHDMAPPEYRLSQDVLIFLIENQDHFLIGMQGTAADEKTVAEVQSGPPTPAVRTPTTPNRTKGGLGRSGSSSSAGGDSVRKYGAIKRNLSLSSRRSKNSVADASPVASSFTSGVHRSNTVPSQRNTKSPPVNSRMSRDGEPHTPRTPITPASPSEPRSVSAAEPQAQSAMLAQAPMMGHGHMSAPEVLPPSNDSSTPTSPPANYGTSSGLLTAPSATGANRPSAELHLVTSKDALSSSQPRSLSNLFSTKSSPPDAERKEEKKKPNKLQKKFPAPSSATHSAHSSTNSLVGQSAPGQDAPPQPPSPLPVSAAAAIASQSLHPLPADATPQRSPNALKPSVSPSGSFRSHSTAAENTDPEQTFDDILPAEAMGSEKPRRWRFSRHAREESKSNPVQPPTNVGSNHVAHQSVSSVSSSGPGRRSFAVESTSTEPTMVGDRPLLASESTNTLVGSEQEKKSGMGGWFKGKLQELKDREAEKKAMKQRTKSPPENQKGTDQVGKPVGPHFDAASPNFTAVQPRSRSLDILREQPKKEEMETSEESTPTPTPASAQPPPSAPMAATIPPPNSS